MRGVRGDRSGRNAGEGKRGSAAQNRHGASAERRASPRDAKRLARRLACRACAGLRVSEDPYDSRRSATPSRGVREAKKQNPGAERAAGTRSAVSNGETYWVVTACAIKMSLPGLTLQSILFAKTFPEEDGPA